MVTFGRSVRLSPASATQRYGEPSGPGPAAMSSQSSPTHRQRQLGEEGAGLVEGVQDRGVPAVVVGPQHARRRRGWPPGRTSPAAWGRAGRSRPARTTTGRWRAPSRGATSPAAASSATVGGEVGVVASGVVAGGAGVDEGRANVAVVSSSPPPPRTSSPASTTSRPQARRAATHRPPLRRRCRPGRRRSVHLSRPQAGRGARRSSGQSWLSATSVHRPAGVRRRGSRPAGVLRAVCTSLHGPAGLGAPGPTTAGRSAGMAGGSSVPSWHCIVAGWRSCATRRWPSWSRSARSSCSRSAPSSSTVRICRSTPTW